MDFQQILDTLKRFFAGFSDRSNRREQRTDTLQQNKGLPSFSKFQIPLEGSWHNSGGFDPTGKGSVGRPHDGVDLRQPGGSVIHPIAPGKVKQVYSDPKGGNAVVVEHDRGYSSYYAHCGTILVHPGQIVDFGTTLATIGTSGNAKDFPHLHLQIWHNGSLIDPGSILPIPAYTPFNAAQEKLWLPGAKAVAQNWNIQKHLNNA